MILLKDMRCLGEILLTFSRIQEYHLTNGYCLFPSEMVHYNQAMCLTLGKYNSYFVDWAGKIKNFSRRGQNEEVKIYAKNSIYCHPVVLGKSLAQVPFTLANFTLVYYCIARHLSIYRHSQSSKKCALHCWSEETITISSKSLSKSVKCKASKKSHFSRACLFSKIWQLTENYLKWMITIIMCLSHKC